MGLLIPKTRGFTSPKEVREVAMRREKGWGWGRANKASRERKMLSGESE